MSRELAGTSEEAEHRGRVRRLWARRWGLTPALAVTFVVGGPARAEARLVLSPLVGEHMVLPVHDGQAWLEGRANPWEKIRAALGNKAAETRADGRGRWRLSWPVGDAKARQRRTPTTLRLGGAEGFLFHDVALGEVWLAAGQSNMAMPTRRAEEGDALAREAASADLRFFRIDNESQDDLRGVRGHWAHATEAEAARFSAVGTSFGVALAREGTGTVGLVQAAWDATPIAAWIREPAWRTSGHGELAPPPAPAVSEAAGHDFEARRAAWLRAARFHDVGDEGFGRGFAAPSFDDRDWKTLEAPGSFESQGLAFDGVIWLRRRLTLPGSCVGRALDLSLGPIDDCDRTFVNGLLVGQTCHELADPYRVPRQYRVPASVVTTPEVLLAVRVVDELGDGGLTGLPSELALRCHDDAPSSRIALGGSWRMFIEREAGKDRPGLADLPVPPPGWPLPSSPGLLARNWIEALAPFALTGVLWYQGENNVGTAARYATDLEVWLADWSAIFENAALPVLLVQLPGHETAPATRGEHLWAQVREAQRQLATKHANVRLVVAADLGRGSDVHPRRKRPVGERAAWLARHPNARATGPWLSQGRREPGGVALTFEAQGPLRTTGDAQVRGFRVVGERQQEEPCLATLSGNTIHISWRSQKINAVRYAYDDVPDGTLTDDTGWPASPFEAQLPK